MSLHPFADDDTRPVKIPVCVQAVRSCRPMLTRIAGLGTGESFEIPAEPSGLVLGRSESAAVTIQDESVSREHARVWRGPSGGVLLTDLRSTNGTIVNGRRINEVVLTEGDKIQIGTATVFRFSLNDRLDETYHDHLYQTSIRDALTGLHNRRYFLECLERDLGLARRHGLPMSLIVIDADHFKEVNDTYGHAGGDRVLRGLAELLGGMQRQESILARYGGEEFAVLLRNVEPPGAEVFAERMRAAVAQADLPTGRGTVRLTASVGLAVTTSDAVDRPEDLLEKADRYLYLSKARGRNRVTSARSFELGE